MTVNINIQEAEVAFSELLNRVSRGEEITITQDGVAIARLVPVTQNPDILNSSVPAIVVSIGPLAPINQNPPKRIPKSAK
ncbi:type II toxin-antitoxin system Phd/YefM family antitoxin [Nostoc sp.]|uniref:type II toxin-antitoxin system Phd/YefM family antitoxin n=1 Tax=Nostoc sp. TaxID=1180 RepID=UPI002FF57C6D